MIRAEPLLSSLRYGKAAMELQGHRNVINGLVREGWLLGAGVGSGKVLGQNGPFRFTDKAIFENGQGVVVSVAFSSTSVSLSSAGLMAYYGAAGDGFHLPFNFHLMRTPWTPTALASLIAAYEAGLPANGWPNWVLSNHDRSRLATRLGLAQARVAAMLLLTLRGTPTLYQGDELGIADVPIPPDRVRDPWELNVPGLGLGRDPVRTPMLWSGAPNAGFSSVEPWLPLSENWRDIHAERQAASPGSLLSLYRELIALRRREPALWGGAYVPVASTDSLLIYEKVAGGERLLVILELSGRGSEVNVPAGTVILTTDGCASSQRASGPSKIPPNSGSIVRLDR